MVLYGKTGGKNWRRFFVPNDANYFLAGNTENLLNVLNLKEGTFKSLTFGLLILNTFFNSGTSCWNKRLPNFDKRCLDIGQNSFFTEKVIILKIAQKVFKYLDFFVRKLVAKIIKIAQSDHCWLVHVPDEPNQQIFAQLWPKLIYFQIFSHSLRQILKTPVNGLERFCFCPTGHCIQGKQCQYNTVKY